MSFTLLIKCVFDDEEPQKTPCNAYVALQSFCRAFMRLCVPMRHVQSKPAKTILGKIKKLFQKPLEKK